MTVESIATYISRTAGAQSPPELTIIDIEAMKAILYLGIRGEIHLPVEDHHTIDTFA